MSKKVSGYQQRKIKAEVHVWGVAEVDEIRVWCGALLFWQRVPSGNILEIVTLARCLAAPSSRIRSQRRDGLRGIAATMGFGNNSFQVFQGN